jgi:hypothetical protein
MNRPKVEVYGGSMASLSWIVKIGEGDQAIRIMFDTWSELRAVHQNLGFELERLEALANGR